MPYASDIPPPVGLRVRSSWKYSEPRGQCLFHPPSSPSQRTLYGITVLVMVQLCVMCGEVCCASSVHAVAPGTNATGTLFKSEKFRQAQGRLEEDMHFAQGSLRGRGGLDEARVKRWVITM